MAKEQDQTQTNDDDKTEVTTVPDAVVKDEKITTAAAVKTSTDFDKKMDEEGVEGEESEPDSSAKASAKVGDEDTAGKGKGAKADKGAKAKGDDQDAAGDEDAAAKADADKGDEPTFSKEILQRAADLGVNPEEISLHKDEDGLRATLDIMDKVVADMNAEEQDTTTQQPAGTKDKTAEVKDDGFKLTFKNEAEIDPELLANIKGMQKHYDDQTKALRDELKAVTGNIQQRQQAEFMARFDGMVTALGEDFTDTFGTGPSQELSNRTNAARNRVAVRTRMYAFAKGLNDAGERVPDEQQLFDMAVNSLHGQKMKTIAGQRMQDKTTARAKGAIGRPAPRRTGNLTPIQKATETSKKFDDLINTSED